MLVVISSGQLSDTFVVLLRDDAGLQQIGRDLLVDKVARNDIAQLFLGRGLGGLVDDFELVTQLRNSAGGIDNTQHLLPETAAHGQQWVVGQHDLLVILVILHLGAPQMTRNLA
ncbi:hypothetical protein FQZ97_1003130 [compost metagenome]